PADVTPATHPAASSLLPPRRPASSPLLPYTTLFRSLVQVHLVAGDVGQAEGGDEVGDQPRRAEGDGDRWPRLIADLVTALGLPEDRKSTRLNSSHDQISYAVLRL